MHIIELAVPPSAAEGGYAVRERMHDHEATRGTARIEPGSGIMSNRGGLGLAGASYTRDYPQQRARRNGRGRGRDCVLKRSGARITLELSIYSAAGGEHAIFSDRRCIRH